MTDRSPVAALAAACRAIANDDHVTFGERAARKRFAEELEAAIAAQVEAERWVAIVDEPEFMLGKRYLFAVAEVNTPGLYLPGKVFVAHWPDRGSATHWKNVPEGPKP
jgi:hypothetical protein